MSSSLLTYSSNTTNSTGSEINREEGYVCDVSKMITVIQAISKDLTGVIVYQDSKDDGIPFSEVKRQTEVAIKSNFLIQGPSMRLTPVPQLNTGNTGIHRRKRAMEGLSRDIVLERMAAIQKQRAKDALDRATLHERDAPDDVFATTTTAPILGIMALADPNMIEMLRTNAEPMDQAVIAQLKFANNAFGPNLPLPPTNMIPNPVPTSEVERPIADRSLGLFFWIILGAVVLIIGVWYVNCLFFFYCDRFVLKGFVDATQPHKET